jgi:hypothetical protein
VQRHGALVVTVPESVESPSEPIKVTSDRTVDDLVHAHARGRGRHAATLGVERPGGKGAGASKADPGYSRCVPPPPVTVKGEHLVSGGAQWLLDELLKTSGAVHVIAGPHQSHRVRLHRSVGRSH